MLGHRTYAVFVDANVLYSRTQRDWLAQLYSQPEFPLFQVHWTEEVLAEVIRSLRREHPHWPGGILTRIHDAIAETFEVGRVSDFLIDEEWPGTDENDRHVHSAAVACDADVLLTADRGFATATEADDLPYEIYSADDFFQLVATTAPQHVDLAIRAEVAYWIERGQEPNLPQALRRAQCPEFAKIVLQRLQKMQDFPELSQDHCP